MSAFVPPGEPGTVTVGVDLGGTGTRIAALSNDGVVLRHITSPTVTGIPPAQAIAGLAHAIVTATAGLVVSGIGIGATGPVDAHGVIRNPDTLPAFSDVEITSILSDRLGEPCVIDNDAVTAAIGEHAYGAGRDSTGLLVITLGTGVGVAALIRGQPVRGADGCHPEAGHIAVSGPLAPCYCGLPTCWEQLASRTALHQLAAGETGELAEKARGGGTAASQVFDTYGERVGVGLATLLTIFRPDRVIIGGSAAQYADLFENGLHRSLNRAASYTCTPALATAELGNLAGAVGAAVIGRAGSRR
jgi:glucokinase